MRTLIKLVALSVVAAGLSAGSGRTQPPPPPIHANPMNGLGLSPDQTKRLEALHNQFGPKMRDMEKALEDKRRAVEALYAQYTLDTGQAQKLNADINKIQKDILDGHLKLQQELRKILTSDQYDKLRSGMMRRRQGFGRPPGDGRPPRQH